MHFQLTDGFDQTELDNYIPVILRHPEVEDICEIKARRYGSKCYIDLTVCMDKDLSVYKSHIKLLEYIEKELYDEFAISIYRYSRGTLSI